MNMLYSPSGNVFLDGDLKASYVAGSGWPDDLLPVKEDVFKTFIQSPPDGKTRIAGEDGLPAWGDIPPPTVEETLTVMTAKKQALINEANVVIAPLKDALEGDYIEASDIPVLSEWQKYRYALTKVDPGKPVWPEKPSA